MSKDAVRARIREFIQSGFLPHPLPRKVWVGASDGRTCFACQEPIERGHVECEVVLASTILAHLHRACFDAVMGATLEDEGQRRA